jgi:hypothetical protein
MALRLACPAATEVRPPARAAGVICGVLELANDGASVRGFQSHGRTSALMDGESDFRTVHGFCCRFGAGEPAGYVRCVIWRARREAEWAARRGPDALRDDQAVRPDRDFSALEEAAALAAGE